MVNRRYDDRSVAVNIWFMRGSRRVRKARTGGGEFRGTRTCIPIFCRTRSQTLAAQGYFDSFCKMCSRKGLLNEPGQSLTGEALLVLYFVIAAK